jgi:hypothetical protein
MEAKMLAARRLSLKTFGLALAASVDSASKDFENPNGAFSPRVNSIQGLQSRGAVFLACHNAIWELAERLITAGTNPDKPGVDALCAELTNHLTPCIVLTPGAVGTLVELAKAGFGVRRYGALWVSAFHGIDFVSGR